ncbi:ATP-binding protein [Paenibacillus sp. HJGM_3]|uniref:ATP-binding protein n=1 Tax=Paenibacillus sp. HJGM_3 TaxID=3379816 RepID=UPI0038582094
MTRDLGSEIDALKQQMADLQQLVQQFVLERKKAGANSLPETATIPAGSSTEQDPSAVFYSGHVQLNGQAIRWQPQERRMELLLGMNSEKAAKVLAALGHKQRLDILKAVMSESLTGAELVERLSMGTTGQLYHHLKALIGADLLVQEPGGRYALPAHRNLPFLLLLAAVNDLLDTTTYMEMLETRNNAGVYFGGTSQAYDAHQLLWAVLENSILEHKAGYGDRVGIFLHEDGSVTVADNGRSIPVQALPNSNVPAVQSILTDIHRFSGMTHFQVPGAEKGISIAVVNALSQKLSVEIRRDGKVHRQDYLHGIPQSRLMTVGLTGETGTSVTFKPEPDLFGVGFDRGQIEAALAQLDAAYPGLAFQLIDG